jgi:A/G-specific adenine glycosylase
MPVDMPDRLAHKILCYFDENARDLPWRNPPGRPLPLADPDWPYRVWLSEIMLQQTTVVTVKPYFAAFTARWPGVSALAAAADADVMSAWAGLGYYARARNLLACARSVVADHGGRFPADEATLLTLPGIGRYTAGAISAIAFGRYAVVVDGNVERVVARLFAEPGGKERLYALASAITPHERAGDFAQAMMDLGATICTPRSPKCLVCPVAAQCKGRETADAFPVKAAKSVKPERTGQAYWIERDQQVYLVTRPNKGLLGGMRALPGGDWTVQQAPQAVEAPAFAATMDALGSITHVFTHFHLTLSVFAITLKKDCNVQLPGEWWPVERLNEAGLPTVFAKAARLATAREEE